MPRAQIKDEETYRALRREGNSEEKSARIANAAAASSRKDVAARGGRSHDYQDWTKKELVERARAIESALRPRFRTQYDEGNVGQLYRRQDEIGTPFCIMVDYDTLGDATVTVRDRDSMLQDRIAQSALTDYLAERL